MSLSLDAREVLAHLNALGYTNVTAEQLKEFIKDLRKLIKYEDRIGAALLIQNKENAKPGPDIFTKLHDIKTTSIQAKYNAPTTKKPTKNEVDDVKVLFPANTLNPRTLPVQTKPKDVIPNNNLQPQSLPQTARTATTTTASNSKRCSSATLPKTPRPSRRTSSDPCLSDGRESRMWIRPRIPKPKTRRTKDAVQLYQFYQKEWERFKQQLPGENDHSELRWKIRHKLMGCDP